MHQRFRAEDDVGRERGVPGHDFDSEVRASTSCTESATTCSSKNSLASSSKPSRRNPLPKARFGKLEVISNAAR